MQRIFRIILPILGLLFFSACGGGSSDTVSGSTPTAQTESYKSTDISIISNVISDSEASIIIVSKGNRIQLWNSNSEINQARFEKGVNDLSLFFEGGELVWIYNNADQSFYTLAKSSSGVSISCYDAQNKHLYDIVLTGSKLYRVVDGEIEEEYPLSDTAKIILAEGSSDTQNGQMITMLMATGSSIGSDILVNAALAASMSSFVYSLDSQNDSYALAKNLQNQLQLSYAALKNTAEGTLSFARKGAAALLNIGADTAGADPVISEYLNGTVGLDESASIVLYETLPKEVVSLSSQPEIAKEIKDISSHSDSANFFVALELSDATAVLKTGQTKSFVLYDDGYYQSGLASSLVRDDTKEIVTDNNKKLMWQDDAAVKSNSRQWLIKENYDNGAWNDTSGETATNYCKDLELGGYDDWRLPSVQELQSIVKDDKINPAMDYDIFVNYNTQFVYWSSTTSSSDLFDAWVVNFMYGNTNIYSKDHVNAYIRCVRDM